MFVCPACKKELANFDEVCPECGVYACQLTEDNKVVCKRRNFARVPVEIAIAFDPVALNTEGNELSNEAFTRNLSISGLYFDLTPMQFEKVGSYLKVSNLIWLEFALPDSEGKVNSTSHFFVAIDIPPLSVY